MINSLARKEEEMSLLMIMVTVWVIFITLLKETKKRSIICGQVNHRNPKSQSHNSLNSIKIKIIDAALVSCSNRKITEMSCSKDLTVAKTSVIIRSKLFTKGKL